MASTPAFLVGDTLAGRAPPAIAFTFLVMNWSAVAGLVAFLREEGVAVSIRSRRRSVQRAAGLHQRSGVGDQPRRRRGSPIAAFAPADVRDIEPSASRATGATSACSRSPRYCSCARRI